MVKIERLRYIAVIISTLEWLICAAKLVIFYSIGANNFEDLLPAFGVKGKEHIRIGRKGRKAHLIVSPKKASSESLRFIICLTSVVLIVTVMEVWAAFQLFLSSKKLRISDSPEDAMRRALVWVIISTVILVAEVVWSLVVQNLYSFLWLCSLAVKNGIFIWIVVPFIMELDWMRKDRLMIINIRQDDIKEKDSSTTVGSIANTNFSRSIDGSVQV